MTDKVGTSELTCERPSHVPGEHVVDFDYWHPQASEDEDIYVALKRLHDGPDILWTPRNGGHWIVTRSDDVRWVRDESLVFSHEEFVLPRGMMNTLMPPVNVDPPYHSRFRAILNPSFTPAAVRSLTDTAREITVELIEGFKPDGSCDFVSQFSRIMPVVVFLGMLGLPVERRDEFVQWATGYLHASEQETKDRSAAAITKCLTEVLADREQHPGQDLFSRIAAWRKNARFQSEDEVIGLAMVAFVGGLDTVTSMLAFTARHLATHPDARRRLVEQPALIPQAAEEYIRRFALSMTGRLIKQDVDRKGVTMRRDEVLLVIDALAAQDERAYPDPTNVDFDRDTSVHDTFGNGAHRCVGEHLARMELIVFMEEWLKRIPNFETDPELPDRTYGGTTIGLSQLGLRWET